jgi:uncharacterized repeat protein (TIGR01451 family)
LGGKKKYMKEKIVCILVCTLLIATSGVVIADWDPDPPNNPTNHKMHYPQMPDPNGWDVHATHPMVCADDWRCSETGDITDIHFWGSWLGDNPGTITQFNIWILSDIPKPYTNVLHSKPGKILWYREISDFSIRGPFTGDQGWYWPEDHDWINHDHQRYYQYNIFLDEADWYTQNRGTIYWLGISAVVQEPDKIWGWKSSINHWNDDGCWAIYNEWDWRDLWEPPYDPVSDDFNALFGRGNELLQGGGTGWEGTWFYYPETYWWNMWFYNEPFDDEKMKRIDVWFTINPTDPVEDAWVIFAINWANDAWAATGNQYPPYSTQDEQYIVRDTLYNNEVYEPVDLHFTYYIWDYNPEWLSVDFQGQHIQIIGGIEHTCFQTLDLAFVITGEEPEEPSVDVDKLVSNDDGVTWSDEVTAALNDKVRFRITVTNDGTTDLTDIKVVDTLPVCLEYDDNADPKEPDDITGNVLTWEFAGPLVPGGTIVIEFDAIAKTEGDNVNEVTVTAQPGPVTASDDATVIVGANNPPLKPAKPSGTTNGRAGTTYTYSSSTTDPEGHMISYLFSWGDGTDSGWTTSVASGTTVSESHSWSSQGSYEIKVKARDVLFAESPYSDPLSVSMPRNRIPSRLFYEFFVKFPILARLFRNLILDLQ